MTEVAERRAESRVPTRCEVPAAAVPAGAIRWLALVTGAAALGGQVGWSRLAGAAVGATFAATTLTLSGAMLGLAAGAALAGPAVRRWGARGTLAGILVACAATMVLVPALLMQVGQMHGYPAFRFLLAGGLLAVAHFPFGAVLPAVAAWRGPSNGRAADGELCALSAFGAVAGAVGVGGFLAAHLPTDQIGWLFGVLLLVSAAPLRSRPGKTVAPPAQGLEARPRAIPAGVVATAFGLGFLGLASEFVWARLLGFYWEASPNCFAWVTASYVAGLASGSWGASRHGRSRPPGRGALALALGLSSLLSAVSAVAAPWAVHAHSPAGRLATAAALLGLPAAAFGASFVLLLRRTAGEGAPGRSLGILSAANAAGSAAGPLALWISSEGLPWPPRILCILACGYGMLALANVKLRSRWGWMAVPLAASYMLGAWTIAPSGPSANDYSARPEADSVGDFDSTVLPFVRGGLEATVVVTRETGVGLDMLWIDRGLQGDTSALGRRIPGRLGRLPTRILNRPPRRALAIGLGTGLTLSGMVEGGAGEVDVAELIPGVIDANRTILAEVNGRVLDRPGVRVSHADGRTMLADAQDPYDLIVADMIFPSVAGAGTLFSREFYALARKRLAADGLFVHWVPCLQLAPRDLSAIVAAFLESFPDGTAWIGSFTPRRLILGLAGGALPAPLPESTAAWMALGPADLRRLAGGSRPLRDSDSGMEYRSSTPPQERLFGEDNLRIVMDLMRTAAPPGPWIPEGRLAAWERSRRSWLAFAEGALAEHAGDFFRAGELYRDAAAGGSGDTDAAFCLEQLRFERHFQEAQEAAFRREEGAALAHLRDAASHPQLARGNLFLGDTLAALGRPAEAAAEFERAASKAPRSADAHMKLALLAWMSGDLARARSAFASACALRPDRPPIYEQFEREIPAARP